tara:strand:- start:7545 stop:8858 length:1314 start_codon:yes stop_codon:yes gene_type:complete
MDFLIKSGHSLKGVITVPGDKSISHRSIILSSLATGTSKITGLLEGEDCLATIEVFRNMGINIVNERGIYSIEGKGLRGLEDPKKPLDFGNSGTSIRLCTGILSAQSFKSILIGDSSLSSRPMQRIVEPLTAMGANITSNNGTLPLDVFPTDSLKSINYSLPVASAQVKSCIMLSALYAEGETMIEESAVTRDHTENMFKQFGIPLGIESSEGKKRINLSNIDYINPTDINICGDFSSASFFILAALICPKSELLIKNVGINKTRIGLLHALRHMGANIQLLNQTENIEPTADILVKSSNLKGIILNTNLVANMIDEMPIFFIAAALSDGITIVKDVNELRTKESDRLQAMADALSSFGIEHDLEEDGIKIYGLGSKGTLNSTNINSYGDHRIAMTSAIASLRSDNEVRVLDCLNVNTSFPNFIDTCKEIGIEIDLS